MFEALKIRTGLKKGDAQSSTLFNIAIGKCNK